MRYLHRRLTSIRSGSSTTVFRSAANPRFAASLTKLLESAEAGKLVVKKDGKEVVVDRATFEVGLWMGFSLDSSAQASLPALVTAAENGQRTWIANVYGAALDLLAPASPAPPPTETSLVTNFHRCNVWFPKSWRAAGSSAATKFFRHDSLVQCTGTRCVRTTTRSASIRSARAPRFRRASLFSRGSAIRTP